MAYWRWHVAQEAGFGRWLIGNQRRTTLDASFRRWRVTYSPSGPCPLFMDAVWFLGNGREAIRQQDWFLHLGKGKNIRTADLPLPYTKRMAHHFMQAPSDFTVVAALRWGQIHGLGGTERLARALTGTHVGTEFEHDDFWITVLQFFIANPMLDLVHVGPIIDYINHQRFASQDVFVAPGVVERRGPAQPNLTMKGRTPESLLRQVEAWHQTLAKTEQPKAEWPRSGIDGFEFVEGAERGGNLKIWTITELLSTKALVAEGRKMKHCVATYAHSCASGACSIWALEVETFEGRSKLFTIEVSTARRSDLSGPGEVQRPARREAHGHPAPLGREGGLAGGEPRLTEVTSGNKRHLAPRPQTRCNLCCHLRQ